jgi:hypothetical protein
VKHYAGWYALGSRQGRVLALLAGPVQDRARAEALLEPAAGHARARYGVSEGDGFTVGWIALPTACQGVFNDALWVKGEFQEYDA